ncbi:hypothetical protein LUW76_33870 [Actinomadura madurae]|uniref:hypothetical protein n=1 Tax=Actinomadura madurae TaxID=1993 RepID=UPI002025F43D|nr:hypothetical protein [Actinomadura madurae]URM98923.1 hypothetical protein LUW76_33870 [Actinomadura madurae]URN09614.1 hypothetical protein LUW74_43870 [Actinomadura madurae]
MPTILDDLGLQSPLVGMAVTAQVRSGGPDGFVCTVAGVGGAGTSTALLPRANAYTLAAGAAPPRLRAGDIITALVMSVSSGVAVGEADRLVLSVTAPALVERILAGFVDELMTGDVVIKGIARVAGAKTKIAVAPTRPGVEPKGAFIGRRANRLRGAENLLNRGFGNERLEVIEFSGDRAAYLVNAMNPIKVSGALVEDGNAVVAVEPHQVPGASGRAA